MLGKLKERGRRLSMPDLNINAQLFKLPKHKSVNIVNMLKQKRKSNNNNNHNNNSNNNNIGSNDTVDDDDDDDDESEDEDESISELDIMDMKPITFSTPLAKPPSTANQTPTQKHKHIRRRHSVGISNFHFQLHHNIAQYKDAELQELVKALTVENSSLRQRNLHLESKVCQQSEDHKALENQIQNLETQLQQCQQIVFRLQKKVAKQKAKNIVEENSGFAGFADDEKQQNVMKSIDDVDNDLDADIDDGKVLFVPQLLSDNNNIEEEENNIQSAFISKMNAEGKKCDNLLSEYKKLLTNWRATTFDFSHLLLKSKCCMNIETLFVLKKEHRALVNTKKIQLQCLSEMQPLIFNFDLLMKKKIRNYNRYLINKHLESDLLAMENKYRRVKHDRVENMADLHNVYCNVCCVINEENVLYTDISALKIKIRKIRFRISQFEENVAEFCRQPQMFEFKEQTNQYSVHISNVLKEKWKGFENDERQIQNNKSSTNINGLPRKKWKLNDLCFYLYLKLQWFEIENDAHSSTDTDIDTNLQSLQKCIQCFADNNSPRNGVSNQTFVMNLECMSMSDFAKFGNICSADRSKIVDILKTLYKPEI